MMTSLRALKCAVFALALLPAMTLVVRGLAGGLGANPIELITHETGEWALRLLLVTLAVTPVRKVTGWSQVVQLRRMLGLFAFFYACLHLTTYVVLDQFFDWRAMIEDVIERPYITIGLSAFLLLVPLAVTSTKAWMRRLRRNWSRLHRLVYPVAIFVVIHYLWLVKADYLEPVVYAAILALLLGMRLMPDRLLRVRKRRSDGRVPVRGGEAGFQALRGRP